MLREAHLEGLLSKSQAHCGRMSASLSILHEALEAQIV